MIEQRLPSEAALDELGLHRADAIARGMEATCFALDDRTIVKIYDGPARTSVDTLSVLERFYASLDGSACQLRLPRIEQVGVACGIPVTVEQRLPGRNMLDVMSATPEVGLDHWLGENLSALEHLRTVTPLQPVEHFRPIVGPNSAASYGDSWFQFLRGTVAHESARVLGHLSRDVKDVRAKLDRLDALLDRPFDGPLHLIHGDFGPFNLLVDEQFQTVSLIDFGMFTFWGDWRFDWAIAWRIFDMYDSMKARATERYGEMMLDRAGRDQQAMLSLYALVYSAIAADAYDPACSDGHFRWCAANLNDQELWHHADRA